MLHYLVSSKSRRRLLELLWRQQASGSVADLARGARVSYGAAYRELKMMVRHGLAVVGRVDGTEVYRAALDHPHAELLRRLLEIPMRVPPPPDERANRTRRRLRALGAPLIDAPEPFDDETREQVLVAGVELARRDPTLARVMPVVVWRTRDALDLERLEATARRARCKHAVGFVLALTGELGGDRALVRSAELFRDARATGTKPFFELPATRLAEQTARRRTPKIAHEWGYFMDLDLASFQTHFDKFERR